MEMDELNLPVSHQKVVSCNTSEGNSASIQTKREVTQIEFLNSQYLVFDASIAQRLLEECRIVSEACGTSFEARADFKKLVSPFVFMPEQVVVLIEYGLQRLFV